MSTPTAPAAPLPFIDLAAQRARLGTRIDDALLRVAGHGQYIMGPEVATLEAQLGAFAGTPHALSCASGTDALALVLMAWGIGPGDAVYVPAFTFAATAEVVAWLGATPVFCDVDPERFTMTPDSLGAAIAATDGLTPRAVIPVDLFGQPADYDGLLPIAKTHGLKVLVDAAQSFGATLDGRRSTALGDAAATSFFPAKPLGAYGDGGAVFVHDATMAEVVDSLRIHGKGTHRYEHVRIGLNGRLDTMQAAVLIEKLAIFEDEIASRNRIAARYGAALDGVVRVPVVAPGAVSVWAQYTIRVGAGETAGGRDGLAERLKAVGIPTAIHYPIPLNAQPAYQHFPSAPGGTPVAATLAGEVLSLPMHPYLDEATQDRIVTAVRAAMAA